MPPPALEFAAEAEDLKKIKINQKSITEKSIGSPKAQETIFWCDARLNKVIFCKNRTKIVLEKTAVGRKGKRASNFFSNLSDIFFRFTLFYVSHFWLTNPTNFGSFPLYLPLPNLNNSNKKQTCSQVACTYKLLIEYTHFRRKSGLLTKRIRRKTKRF